MKSLSQRLTNVAGQINGVQRLVATGADCLAVLTQLKATRAAISSIMDTVIADKFDSCLQSLPAADKKLLINFKKYVQSP